MNTITTCVQCRGVLEETTKEITTCDFGGWTFAANIPHKRCGSCAEEYIDDTTLLRFEDSVARALLDAEITGRAHRAMRVALRLSLQDCAAVLQMDSDTIQAEEKRLGPVDVSLASAMKRLVRERLPNREGLFELRYTETDAAPQLVTGPVVSNSPEIRMLLTRNVRKPSLEEMAITILRHLHDVIHSRETEVPIDSNDESPNAPTRTIKGMPHQDEDDPCVSLTTDWGPGSGTIYYGTTGKPLGRHTHFGGTAERSESGEVVDPERVFATFVRGLYRHFCGEGLSLDIPMSEVAIVTESYKVEYEIDGFVGEYSAGPYPNMATATDHLRDIAGYEGVRNARIVPVSAPREPGDAPVGKGEPTDE